MNEQKTYSPVRAFHPGITLREKIGELGMSIKEFSLRSSKPEKTINAVLNGSSSITPDMAVAFEQVTRIPAHMWLNLQSVYDIYKAREKKAESFQDPATMAWAECFPYEIMVTLQWVPDTMGSAEKVENLFSFFGLTSVKAWEDLYLHQELKVSFSISLREANNPYALSSWLRRGEILAQQMEMQAPYDINVLKDVIPEMLVLSRESQCDCIYPLRLLCAKAGIRLVVVPHIPNAPVNGCVRWIGEAPCILLTDNVKESEKFWYYFFHELGHIVLHGKKDIFLEDETMHNDPLKESEADRFAEGILLSV